MRWWISFAFAALAATLALSQAAASPVEFGLADLKAALASRNLKTRFEYDLNLEPAETFRIEPYKAGGVHITGGDLRGLMYGLLEAAEQIRSTGRFAQVHAVPSITRRGVRMFTTAAELEKSSVTEWRGYFEMLARDRFNRFTLVFAREDPLPALGEDSFELPALRVVLQAAADYGIDFTLGLWQQPDDPEALRTLLVACPQLKTIQVMDAAPESFGEIFKVLHESGHRVALEPRGASFPAEFLRAANGSGVPVTLPPPDRSGGFDIDPPGGLNFESRSMFYWLWGRLGYDPKAKLIRTEPAEKYRASVEMIGLLAAAGLTGGEMYLWPVSNPGIPIQAPERNNWGGVATISEAVRNRLEGVASAKETAVEIADRLLHSAEDPHQDLLLAGLGRYHAHKLRSAYALELFDQTHDVASLDVAQRELESAVAAIESASADDLADIRVEIDRVGQRRRAAAESDPSAARPVAALAKPLPRPQITHMPVKTAHAEEPLILNLEMTPTKDMQLVRLHCRISGRADKVMDQPASASLNFVIPGPDVPTGAQILYYFEILTRDKGGWAEPDPGVPDTPFATPYYVVRVSAPTAPN